MATKFKAQGKNILHNQDRFCLVLKDYGLVSTPFVLNEFSKQDLLKPGKGKQYQQEQIIVYDNIRRHLFKQYQLPIIFQQHMNDGKTFATMLSSSPQVIKNDLKKLSTILSFLKKINNICADAGLNIERILIDSKVNGYNRKDIERDYKASRKHELKNTVIPGLKKLIKTFGFSIKDLQEWQSEFAFLGKQHDDTKDFFGYMECIPLVVRRRAKNPYRLAMLYYDYSYDLEWVLRQLDEKTVHLHTLVTNMPYQKVCVYCNAEYEPVRADSKNCAKKACQQAYKNHQKRIQRELGNYS
ncbi:MAG: hypothetical protein WCV88_00785 [Patescibacteria group bacterium]